MKAHYPKWDIAKSLTQTVKEIMDVWQERLDAK
jgi:hypothetical protein